MTPRHIGERDFKRDEKIAKLAKERRESKKASSSRRIPIDHTIPSWKRGSYTAINSFLASHDIDRMVPNKITTESRANEHNENQNENSGTIVEFQTNASGNSALTDGASSYTGSPIYFFLCSFFTLTVGYLLPAFEDKLLLIVVG
uniref:Uncharacterized protein n=1 Tax=Solanum tuberosum TaxID=4113 RepID=M1DF25_SOLTU